MSWSTSPHSCSRALRGMRGFTLIEVLIAISILAILLTSVYGIFSSVSSTGERLEADSDEFHRARVIFDRLGRELRGTYEPPGNQERVFNGGTTPDGKVFLELATSAVSPLSDVGTGIALVYYTLADDKEEGASGRVLLRSETPWHLKNVERRPDDMMRLAPGIGTMALRFYANGDWHQAWDAQSGGLPDLVEISLLFNRDDHKTTFRSAFELPKRGPQ